MPGVQEYLEICFSGANVPATVLLILASMYWALAIVAGLDFDLLDFDFDMDGQGDLGETVGIGVVVLRLLNIGSVPLMIWASMFAILWWMLSMSLDILLDDPETREVWPVVIQHGIRNFAIAVVLTKIFTQPLRGKFEAEEPNPTAEMLGKQCRVTTSEVTAEFGQAQYETEAAPLLLNVRTRDSAPLVKGDMAVLVEFEPEKNIYFIEKVKAEG